MINFLERNLLLLVKNFANLNMNICVIRHKMLR
jgi:hypothetical protein